MVKPTIHAPVRSGKPEQVCTRTDGKREASEARTACKAVGDRARGSFRCARTLGLDSKPPERYGESTRRAMHSACETRRWRVEFSFMGLASCQILASSPLCSVISVTLQHYRRKQRSRQAIGLPRAPNTPPLVTDCTYCKGASPLRLPPRACSSRPCLPLRSARRTNTTRDERPRSSCSRRSEHSSPGRERTE